MKKIFTIFISLMLIVSFGVAQECPPVNNLKVEYTSGCDARLTWSKPTKSLFTPIVPEVKERTNAQTEGGTCVSRGFIENLSNETYPLSAENFVKGPNSSIVYKVHPSSGQAIYKATLSSFPGTQIGSSSISLQAMEYINGEIYAVNYSASTGNALGKINPDNGTWTLIKSSCGFDAISLCYNPTNGLTYITQWGSGTDFGTVDLETGSFSSIGQLPEGLNANFYMAIDNDGVAYAVHGGTSEFGTINLATGAFAPITTLSLPFNPGGVQNMGVDRETNELYYIGHYIQGGTPATVYKINKTNGQVTTVANLSYAVESFAILTDAPDNCDPVSELTHTVDGSTVTLSWTAAPGSPTGYRIIYDGATLTEITATTYTHTGVPEGVHYYEVAALYSGSCVPYSIMQTVIVGAFCRFRIEMEDYNFTDDGHPMGWTDDGSSAAGSMIEVTYQGGYATFAVPYDAPYAMAQPYFPAAELKFAWVNNGNDYDYNRAFRIYNSEDELLFEAKQGDLPLYGIFLTYQNDCGGAFVIYKYNIYRDGEIIKENIDPTSYIDQGFDPLQEHEWSVEAVCDEGSVSAKETVSLDACVNSVNDIVATAFTIVPNPASTTITITSERHFSNIEIVNFLGQTVISKVNDENKAEIDVSNLSSGIYFVRILTHDGASVQKFVKK